MNIYPVRSRRIKKFRNFKRILRVFDIIVLNITYEKYKSLTGDSDIDDKKYNDIITSLNCHRMVYNTIMMKSVVSGMVVVKMVGTTNYGRCYNILNKNNVKVFPCPVINDDGTEMEIEVVKSEGEYSLIINNSRIHV